MKGDNTSMKKEIIEIMNLLSIKSRSMIGIIAIERLQNQKIPTRVRNTIESGLTPKK